MEVITTGDPGAEKAAEVSKTVAEVLEDELGVPRDRYFATFFATETYQIGWGGTTFGDDHVKGMNQVRPRE